MKKWEYNTVPLLSHAMASILNTWGEDGWELVTVRDGATPDAPIAFFKREVVEG